MTGKENGGSKIMNKLLFVTSDLRRGGAQRVISLLANEYAKRGWNVHIAVLLDTGIGYEISESIHLHNIVRHGNYLINAARWVKDVRKIITKEKPDAIVAFAGRINIITMLASIGKKTPIMVSERNDPKNDRRSRIEVLLCKYFYKKANKVVFQTSYQKEQYGHACEKNGVVIGNPISAPAYEGEHIKRDIICVGKLMDQKNHPMMIRAFARLANQFPQKQVYIYGDGSKQDELQKLIDDLNMSSRIHLCGNSEHIFEIMREYQYFVMCSDYEGLSNALLEAMISGMVCVTTAWNGVEEIVVDGENGYLVPVGNEDALVDKLRTVLDNDNSAITYKSIETAKRFASDNIMSIWRDTIDGLCKTC